MQDITREQSHEIKAEIRTVIDGKTSEHSRLQATHMVATLNRRARSGNGDRFGHSHIYQGTANPRKVNARRAKNRVGAKSRRANRGK